MDLSFSRRKTTPAALDLATLLAGISAAQAASPTARLQAFLDRKSRPFENKDARIAFFASPAEIDARSLGASFAAMFSSRQPK